MQTTSNVWTRNTRIAKCVSCKLVYQWDVKATGVEFRRAYCAKCGSKLVLTTRASTLPRAETAPDLGVDIKMAFAGVKRPTIHIRTKTRASTLCGAQVTSDDISQSDFARTNADPAWRYRLCVGCKGGLAAASVLGRVSK